MEASVGIISKVELSNIWLEKELFSMGVDLFLEDDKGVARPKEILNQIEKFICIYNNSQNKDDFNKVYEEFIKEYNKVMGEKTNDPVNEITIIPEQPETIPEQQEVVEIPINKEHPDFPRQKFKNMFRVHSDTLETFVDILYVNMENEQEKEFLLSYCKIFHKLSNRHNDKNFDQVYDLFIEYIEDSNYSEEKSELNRKIEAEQERLREFEKHKEEMRVLREKMMKLEQEKELAKEKDAVLEKLMKAEEKGIKNIDKEMKIESIKEMVENEHDKESKIIEEDSDDSSVKENHSLIYESFVHHNLDETVQKTKEKSKKNAKKKKKEKKSKLIPKNPRINSNPYNPSNPSESVQISKSDIIIEIQIKYPEESERFKFIRKFFQIDNKDIFSQYLDNQLSKTQYSPGDNCNKIQLEKEIMIKDTFSSWSFDVFFNLFKIYIKTSATFPKMWKIIREDDSSYNIEITELKKEALAYDINMDINLFLDTLAAKTDKKEKKIFQQAKEKFDKQGLRRVADLIQGYEVQENIFDELWGIKKDLIEELNNFSLVDVNAKKENVDYLAESLEELDKPVILFLANLHKVKRFFYHQVGRGDEVGYLSKICLDSTYNVLIREYKNEDLLGEIKRFYYCLTYKKESFKDYSIPRGVLFYGPPGTGKTTVAEKFPELIGLTGISYPISSTEVSRGIVGETEKLLQELCQRAHRMPHLICYLSVDEIDALVPRRDDKDNKSKGDSVATLLSLIGGIKDVPNLIFVASTNFMKKIDEAFSRRMSGKFFVGRLDKDGRQKFLDDVNHVLTENAVYQAIEDKRMEMEAKGIKIKNLRKLKKRITENIEKKIKKEKVHVEMMNRSLMFIDDQEEGDENVLERTVIDLDEKDFNLDDEDVEIIPRTSRNSNSNANKRVTKNAIKNSSPKPLNIQSDSKHKTVSIVIVEDLRRINPILINFTPAAMKRLISDIAEEALSTTQIVDLNKIKKIAAKCAKQFNIRLGNYYLPEVIDINDLLSKNKSRIIIPDKDHMECLGLIIVDLCNKELKFKIRNHKRKKICYEDRKLKTTRPISSAADILLDLSEFAFNNDIIAGQLIDVQSLLNNGAYDDQKFLENITEITTEMKEYRKSMIIFDLDSLVGLNISKSDGMGNSTSKSIGNSKMFYYIKDIANNDSRVVYEVNKDNQRYIDRAFWGIVVVKDEYLLDTLIECLGIEKSTEQKRREEEERKEQDKTKDCVRCRKKYKEKDNKNPDACYYHLGMFYDSFLPVEEWRAQKFYPNVNQVELSIHAKMHAYKKEMERKKAKSSNNKEEGLNVIGLGLGENDNKNFDENTSSDKNPFLWICCNKSYGEQGCKNSTHTDNWEEFEEELQENYDKMMKNLKEMKEQIDKLQFETGYSLDG